MYKKLKILLVEDNTIQAINFELILQEAGHEVTMVRSGEDAATRIITNPSSFDAIITDVDMIPGNGITLLEHLRANLTRPLPVLVHSSARFFFSSKHGRTLDLEKDVTKIYPSAEFHIKDLIFKYFGDFLQKATSSRT